MMPGSWDAESLSEAPDVGPVKRWIYGVLLAALPVAFGIWCIVQGRTPLCSRYGVTYLTGQAGVALAAAYIAVGVFCHVHFFWAAHPKLWRAARAAKVLIIVVFIAGLGYAVLLDNL